MDLPAAVRREGFAGEVAPGRAAAPPLAQPSIRTNSARIANQELARWGNGAIKEIDPRMRRVLQDYWATGTGNRFSEAQVGDPGFQNSHPWSAAFISWVMRRAGGPFRRASAHSVYIKWAKDNRVANNANPYKAYRVTEVAPQVGDLVCKSRAGSGATYDNIRPGMKTHCDIVTEVRPGSVVTVGGNVRNSVSQTIVRTDGRGFIQDPAYFAVIQAGPAGGSAPSVRPAPPPPLPQVAGAPRLVRSETTPPGMTLYVNIDLRIVDRFNVRAAPLTGIFIPDNYRPGAAVDVILYLHGFKGNNNRTLSIDQYWLGSRFPYRRLREGVNASGRNVILVAPTLGSRSEAGQLLRPGGLDAFLSQVLAALRAYGPHRGAGRPPVLGHLILASHSGGGKPMRALAGNSSGAGRHIREAWGFDSTYNQGDDTVWAGWARSHPQSRVYFYYIAGSQTAALAERLKRSSGPNVVVGASKDRRHDYVPITYWRERIVGAPFLQVRPGVSPRPAPPPGPQPGPGPQPRPQPAPGPSGEVDVKRMTHAEFIEFVGRNAKQAMAQTGVPASVTVAQAIVETGWGKHSIGAAKNLFGIKGRGPAGSVRTPTREFINGKWITVQADFAAYNSFDESIAEHARFFVRNKRYAAALQYANDPDRFAREIHKAGYATAPTYADVLIGLMRRYNLYRFDR